MSIPQESIEKMFEGILTELARKARAKARPHVPSVTLRKSMGIFVDTRNRTSLVHIPYYWALWVHDGTRSIWSLRGRNTARGKRNYVYFRNKRNDPRLKGKRAAFRLRDQPSLTEKEYQEGLRKNRRHRKLGLKPYMYVLKVVKSPTPTPGAQFFNTERGMRGFPEEAALVVARRFTSFVKKALPKGDDQTLTLRLF